MIKIMTSVKGKRAGDEKKKKEKRKKNNDNDKDKGKGKGASQQGWRGNAVYKTKGSLNGYLLRLCVFN